MPSYAIPHPRKQILLVNAMKMSPIDSLVLDGAIFLPWILKLDLHGNIVELLVNQFAVSNKRWIKYTYESNGFMLATSYT